MNETKERWNVGLVGTGYWSERHLRAWRQIPGVRIAALCDKDAAKLAARGREFGVPPESLYRDAREMLQRTDLDAVDIVTGPETHVELVTLAAEAGKHMLCQKPFAPSLEEAQRMVRVAANCGARLMVTENWRWLQPFQLIKQVLEGGALGRIRTARYVHTDYYTPRMAPGVELPQQFFRTMPRLLFYEMGAHWFDTIRYLFGEPKRLYAETLRISPHIAGEDAGIVTLGYDDKVVVLDASWATRRELAAPPGAKVGAEHREQVVVEGEEATLKLYMDSRIAIVGRDGRETTLAERTELDFDESHVRLQTHFIDALRMGTPFQTSGEDNLATLRLIFATYESAETHQVVHL